MLRRSQMNTFRPAVATTSCSPDTDMEYTLSVWLWVPVQACSLRGSHVFTVASQLTISH